MKSCEYIIASNMYIHVHTVLYVYMYNVYFFTVYSV